MSVKKASDLKSKSKALRCVSIKYWVECTHLEQNQVMLILGTKLKPLWIKSKEI